MQWKDKLINYLIDNGPKLLVAVLIVIGGFMAARWVGAFLMAWLSRKELEPPVRTLMVRLVRLVIVVVATLIALGTLKVDILPLVAGLSVIGVGVGLAMQGVLGNLVAGLTIIFTKPFRVGEYVEMVGVQGQVETIELFSTILLHGDRSRVVIPNRKIVGEILHNYGTIRQLDLQVGVAYNTNLSQMMALLREIVAKNPRVLKELTPGLGITMLADSSINVSVKPWVQVADCGPAQAELYQSIVEQFRANKIEIPFPHREVSLLNSVPALAAMAR